MLRSVAEVSVLTGLSKVSIYNKIKLKEIEKYVVKNKGITYISDEGINLIFEGLNFKDDTLNGFANCLNIDREDVDVSIGNADFKEFKLELKELNKDYLNSLNSENEFLKKQLDEKDKQISELHKLIENSQILLKEEQKKSEQQLYLAEHFEEVDNKLQDLKEKMEKKRNEKIKLFKIFSK
jgi:predicted RNase H-like nuclease (RuvC/YqgF family)